ncbi:hypothetical protein A2U01_0016424, partial [Trifolium medium]|nr:hypothetical protein [Trifolium medium]
SERSSGEPNDDGPCPADNNSTFSDTVVLGSEEGTDRDLCVAEADGTNEEFCEERREGLVVGDGHILEGNPFLALTWLDGEVLGEDQERVVEKSLSAQRSGKRLVKTGTRVLGDVVKKGEGDVAMISNEESFGLTCCWAAEKEQGLEGDKALFFKGKGIIEVFGDVAMKDRELFRGCASRSVIGPNGPLNSEFQYVKLLKNKEVAQLEEDYNKEIALEKTCAFDQHKKK